MAFVAQNGLPVPVREFRFHPSRRWRFDFAWEAERVALECDGGIWSHGRHSRGKGWLADTEKLNEAACRGWRLLRTTPDALCTAETLRVLTLALAAA